MLGALQADNPLIYDPEQRFFAHRSVNEEGEPGPSQAPTARSSKKVRGEEPERMYLRDYERKLIKERGGKLSDSEEEMGGGKGYVAQEQQLRQEFLAAVNALSDDDERGSDTGGKSGKEVDNTSGLLQLKVKTKEEQVTSHSDSSPFTHHSLS